MSELTIEALAEHLRVPPTTNGHGTPFSQTHPLASVGYRRAGGCIVSSRLAETKWDGIHREAGYVVTVHQIVIEAYEKILRTLAELVRDPHIKIEEW